MVQGCIIKNNGMEMGKRKSEIAKAPFLESFKIRFNKALRQ